MTVFDTDAPAAALDRATRDSLMVGFETDHLLNSKADLLATVMLLAENNAAFALTIPEDDPRLGNIGRLDGFFADVHFLLSSASITLPDGTVL